MNWTIFGILTPKKKAIKHVVDEAIQPMKADLGRIAEYVDGLPKAAPEIRDPFLEAQELEEDYKYNEAIRLYETCFQRETTASQLLALHILIGNCFYRISELEEAEGHYRRAETAASEVEDKEGLATAYNNIGLIYDARGGYDKALDWYVKSLKITEEIGDRAGLAATYNNIAGIYSA